MIVYNDVKGDKGIIFSMSNLSGYTVVDSMPGPKYNKLFFQSELEMLFRTVIIVL